MIEILSKPSLSHLQYGVASSGRIPTNFAPSLMHRGSVHVHTLLHNRGIHQLRSPLQNPDPAKGFIRPYKMTAIFEPSGTFTPIVGCAVHKTATAFGPKISALLSKTGSKVKEIDINLDEIDVHQLQTEVAQGIEEIRKTNPNCMSIPEELLKNARPGSIIAYIRDWAVETLKSSHGLSLPGGANVEPAFYDRNGICIGDYRRSIAEFALIAAAKKLNKPGLGTCRGAQIFNVFFGGTLEPLGSAHIGWQQLRVADSSRKAQLEQLFEGLTPKAYSHHFQHCKAIAPNFEVAMHTSDGVPKLLVSKNGGHFIGIQFHPEQNDCDMHPDMDDNIMLSLLEDNPDQSIYTTSIRVYKLFYEAMFESQPKSLS